MSEPSTCSACGGTGFVDVVSGLDGDEIRQEPCVVCDTISLQSKRPAEPSEADRERARRWAMATHRSSRVLSTHIDALASEFASVRAEERDAALAWADKEDEWSGPIRDAFPTRSGSHEEYGTAMRMVSNRHSKGELVALINWLLVRISQRSRLDAAKDKVIAAARRYFACDEARESDIEQALAALDEAEKQA